MEGENWDMDIGLETVDKIIWTCQNRTTSNHNYFVDIQSKMLH